MNSIQSSLYTVAIALCVFSTGIIRDGKRRTGRPTAWFTTFLVVETLALVFELLMVHPATPLKALWLGLRIANTLLIGPCLWLAVKEGVEGVRPKLSELGRKQWIVIGVGFALLLPLFETAHFGRDYFNPERLTSWWHNRVIHGGMLLCISIFAVQAPIFLWRCRQLLVAQFNREHLSGSPGSARSLAWLHLPLLVVLTTWLLGILRALQCAAHLPQELSLIFAATDVGVTVGAIYMIVRRASTHDTLVDATAVEAPDATVNASSLIADQGSVRPQVESATRDNLRPVLDIPPVAEQRVLAPILVGPITISSPPAASSSPAEPIEVISSGADPELSVPVASNPETRAEGRYAKSALDAATRQRIVRKLATAMEDQAICCDSLISLRALSQGIRENAHYVSQVINQDLDCTFYELVNRSRIALAKKRLLDAPDQTVLEIALAVGFNSKSTFNAAFRRITGTTPKAFRARGEVGEN